MFSRSVCIVLIGVPALGHSQDFGPISVPNQRALSTPFLRLDPTWGVLSKGKREVRADFRASNDSRKLGTVEEDQETDSFVFGYRQGLGNGKEWGVVLPLLSRGGGFLDPIITWWHINVLHWQDPYRASQPNGRSIVSVPGAQFGSASGIGDIRFRYRQVVSQRIQSELAVKLPTGSASRLLGSGALDFAGGLKWSSSKWKIDYHLQFGYVFQGNATRLPNSRRWVDQSLVGLVYRRNSRDGWIAQWQSESSATRTGEPGSDAAHRQLVFGYQRKINENRMFELHFTEDRDVFNGKFPLGANVAPDFGIGIGYRVRF